MADSILRLKVESQEYDSKLKRASEGIQRYADQCRKVGGTLEVVEKDTLEFVKAVGQMETVSNTAKGKINEMSSSFINLTAQYKQLTEAEKQSPFGKALSQSLDQLKERAQQAKQELADINKELNGASNIGGGGSLFSGDKLSGMLQVFGGNVMTKIAGAGLSLASELGDAVKQGIELAKQGEGIRIAFERLGRGDILQGLREATHGTVTDLELMKAAVKFNDFKLPLDELGTMLEFAQQKAKDTGQSVDYMVDSIVTGLGRKSLMILDNLGLSATEIRERMKETGDMTKAVGDIIREQMAKAGDYVETAADRAAQANVSLQNKMEELGRKFAPLQEASNQLWTSMKIGILDVVGGPLARLLNGLTEAGRLMNAYGKMGGSGKVGRMTANLAGASEQNRQSIYQQQQQKFWQYINPREQQIKDIRAWQRGERGDALQSRVNAITEKYGSLDATKIQAEVDAAKKMLAEYQQAAKSILTPIKTNIDTSGAETNVDSLKKKTGSGSGGTNPAKQAADRVANALHAYEQEVEKARMQMDNGTKTEADYKKQLLSAQERLWDAYGDAYNIYKDPKYKQAQDECAAKIKKLGGEVTASIEAQKKAQESALLLQQAQKKLAEAQTKLAEARGSGDLKQIYTAEKNVTTAQREVQRLTQKVDVVPGTVRLPDVPKQIEQVVSTNDKTDKQSISLTTSNLDAFIGNLKEQISQSDVGSELYNKLTERMADANALSSVIEFAVQNGIDTAQFDTQELWKKIFDDGADIPDGFWEKLTKGMGKQAGKKFEIDTKTGKKKEGKDDNDDFKKFAQDTNKIVSLTSNMANGLQALGVELPEGFNRTLSAMQGISSILTVISTILVAIQAISASGATASWVDALMPFSHGGVVRAAGGVSIVPGNRPSGDTVPALLESGEVVLNRAQVNNLSSILEGGGGMQNLQLEAVVTGEQIRMALNNNGRRTGRGEYVQSNRR